MNGTPLRVYVGAEAEQALAFEVLAYSIRKSAAAPVDIIHLGRAIASAGIHIPEPQAASNRQYTPFSFQRFAIPELNGFSGMAIYLDSDMLVFRDVHELLRLTPPEADVAAVAERANSGRKSQISVLVMDCQRLDWEVRRVIEGLDVGRYTYRELHKDLPIARRFARALPSCWNDLERYTPNETALTHFTDMETQPWLYAGNRLGELWCEMLFSALSAGVIPERRVLDHVARGWIRPSLGYQVEHGIVAPSELPERVVRRDTWSFTPPHRVGIIPGKGARWLAGKVTSCGKPHPSAGAVLMRSVQAVGYQAYKRLRGRRLLAD